MRTRASASQGKPAIAGGRPVRDAFLVFGSPLIEEPEIQEVVDTLRSGWIGTGPKAARFEKEFARYKEAPHAVALNSCTAALHTTMVALGIGPGDEVITTPMTFCATANAILHAGARPVFADCGRDTMNIDPGEIARKITPRTRAIIPVHFAGRPCRMDAIMALAKEHRLRVIEDCAHAIETRYKGKPVGTFGDAGCFSFYVTKNIVTGEGGMVVTGDPGLEAKIKMYALHGMSRDAWKRFSDEGYKHYQVIDAGFKYNMTDLQASLGLHQLPRVERYLKVREAHWRRYEEGLAGLPCALPASPEPDTVHARHLFTILLDLERLAVNRDFVLNALTRENIGVGVHYLSLHSHPFYARFLADGERLPNAEYISERTISLPLSARMTDADVEDVVCAVRRILLHYQRK